MSSKSYKKKFYKKEEESEPEKNFLDIWRINPSYKGISTKIVNIKMIWISGILMFVVLSLYLITSSLSFAIGLSISLLLFFIIAFSEDFFCLPSFSSFFFRRLSWFNPFKNLEFWGLCDDPETLMISNKQDAMNIAVQIFQVTILPENVHANINQFLKAMNESRLRYSYQVIQNPMIDGNNNTSRRISIYFSIYHQENGILSKARISKMNEVVNTYSKTFHSNYSANFMHAQLTKLAGRDLINAVRRIFCNDIGELDEEQEEDYYSRSTVIYNYPKMVVKAVFTTFLIVCVSFILLYINTPLLILAIVDLALEISLVLLFWREFLYAVSKARISRDPNVIFVNPLVNIKFYKWNRFPDTIFFRVNDSLLIALKSFNLKNATQPSYCYSDKFFRAINAHQLSFSYNLHLQPDSRSIFLKECSKDLNENAKEQLDGIAYVPIGKDPERKVKYPEIELLNWMNIRSGVWKTTLTLSTFAHKNVEKLKWKDFIELEQDATVNAQITKNTFEDNYLNLKLTELKNQALVSGIQTECLKCNTVRLNGTHLNYIHFQGKNLLEIAKIADEFKKGMETKIAAEFNTPTQLENFIEIGHTINTEFLELEVPFGFKREQLKRMLITNGTSEEREDLMAKILMELVKKDIPSILFDFSGNSTSVIDHFKNSPYENEFQYFKLGSSFNINLLKSDMKYDNDNKDYINYFFDAFALAFKESKKNVEVLKQIVVEKEKLDTSSIKLDIQHAPKWEKNPQSDLILSFLKEFTEQTLVFTRDTMNFEKKVVPIDFVKNDKTILIDVSILNDLEHKVFVSFVIMAKIIHYIKNSEDYYEKMVFIPNIDLFFDAFYLDKESNFSNYGKIDSFLKPLLQKGFGLVFSANQVRYLHSNVFNFIKNIIAFRTTDSRDIAMLKNHMNLQELNGIGYYSSSRNNTYQINYLINMRENEVVVKRDDIYQPFPGLLTLEEVHQCELLNDTDIVKYMDKQGYNVVDAERRILQQARKTLFEKDLGMYSGFIEEIINFLRALKTIDNIGNLYKAKIKKELMSFIYPKASQRTKNKRNLQDIRDNIFDLLVKHDYLIEAHPKQASGSEPIRASYIVGPKYQVALDDYFQSKQKSLTSVTIEAIESELDQDHDITTLFQERVEEEKLHTLENDNVQQELISGIFYKLFLMDQCIKKGDYDGAITYGTEARATILNNENLFPQKYARQLITNKIINKEDIENNSKEMYNILMEFFVKATL